MLDKLITNLTFLCCVEFVFQVIENSLAQRFCVLGAVLFGELIGDLRELLHLDLLDGHVKGKILAGQLLNDEVLRGCECDGFLLSGLEADEWFMKTG